MLKRNVEVLCWEKSFRASPHAGKGGMVCGKSVHYEHKWVPVAEYIDSNKFSQSDKYANVKPPPELT